MTQEVCAPHADVPASAWLSLGRSQIELGRYRQAGESLRRAEALLPDADPALPECWSLMGQAAQARSDWTAANASFRRVTEVLPLSESAWHELGACFLKQDDLREAERCFARAIAIRPDFDASLRELIRVFLRSSRAEQALDWIDRLAQFHPEDSDVGFFRAEALRQLWRLPQALEILDGLPRAVQNTPALLTLRGSVLGGLKRHVEALDALEHSIALDPGYSESVCLSAYSLLALHRTNEALACVDRLLEDNHLKLDALRTKAVILTKLGRYEEALDLYDRRLAMPAPDKDSVTFDRSLVLLALGDFEKGWPGYEARWRMQIRGKTFAKPSLGIADWQGETLEGKSIFLYLEQGLGDSIQMLRYVPDICQRAGKVVIAVPPALRFVLGKLPTNCRVIIEGQALPPCDFACPFMSLPRLLGTDADTIPHNVPYLAAPEDLLTQWRQRLGPARGLRVGLVWSGNPEHEDDHNRSIPLARLIEHAPADVEFFGLQKDVRESDRAALEGWQQLCHLGEELQTFGDTAAVAELMDVILSVDTSVAHLAGALGRPISILLPRSPDWRWMLDRDDSPWYPTAKLYRQTVSGAWSPVIARAMSELVQRGRRPDASAACRPSGPTAAVLTFTGQVDMASPQVETSEAPQKPSLQLGALPPEESWNFLNGEASDAVALPTLVAGSEALVPEQPHDAAGWHALGLSFANSGQLRAAAACFVQALGIHSDFEPAVRELGRVLLRARRGADALSWLDRLLALRPGDSNAQIMRAEALALTERWEETLHALDLLAERDREDPRALALRCEALHKLGRHESARAWIGEILTRAPHCFEAHKCMACTLIRLGRLPQARLSLDLAEALLASEDPAVQLLWCLRAEIKEADEDWAAAAALYRRVVEAQPAHESAWYRMGHCLGQKGDRTEAEKCIARSLSIRGDFPDALRELGRLLLQGAKPAEALTCLDRLVLLVPADHEATTLRAKALHLLGRLQEALEVFDRSPAACDESAESNVVRGMVLQELGRRDEAMACFDKALALTPACDEALMQSGSILVDWGRPQEALDRFERVLAIKPLDSFALNNKILTLVKLDRAEEARQSLASAESALSPRDPRLAEICCLAGREAEARRDWSAAEAAYRRAISVQPVRETAWHLCGQCLASQGKLRDAEVCFTRAVMIRSDFTPAVRDLAKCLLRMQRAAEATPWINGLMEAAPENGDTLLMRADALRLLRQFPEAIETLDCLDELTPNNPQAIHLRGVVLYYMRQPHASLECFEKLLTASPDFVDALTHSALPLFDLHRHDEALARLDRVLARDPKNAEALSLKGCALTLVGRCSEALEALNRRVDDFPEADATVFFNRAVTLLLMGDYERGWKDYEARWMKPAQGIVAGKPRLNAPEWQGESLAGKCIFLYSEQGLGDMIQMLRYVPTVARRASKVVLGLPSALHPVVGKLPANCDMIGEGQPMPECDFACPYLSLPRVLGTTLANIPNKVPYLTAPPELIASWRARLGPPRCLRVGLAWSGNAKHENDHNRSIPLAQLLQHAPADVEFLGLQKEVRESDMSALQGASQLRYLGDELQSFGDTAAVAELMDVIVTVDTSVAHLACALGRPVSILLPTSVDWRWLLAREDSPWYPTARLYRQSAAGQWSPTIARAMADLPERARRSTHESHGRSATRAAMTHH